MPLADLFSFWPYERLIKTGYWKLDCQESCLCIEPDFHSHSHSHFHFRSRSHRDEITSLFHSVQAPTWRADQSERAGDLNANANGQCLCVRSTPTTFLASETRILGELAKESALDGSRANSLAKRIGLAKRTIERELHLRFCLCMRMKPMVSQTIHFPSRWIIERPHRPADNSAY